ncbi:hypothetical protein TNCV_3365351 [Trichonephila clavipes]|nr:hypothetical protein TNCV_3365351 [Trichonephila clavipes]
MLKHFRSDIFELQKTKSPVQLINTTNERIPVQGHETSLRVKGDIEVVSSELNNGYFFLDEMPRILLFSRVNVALLCTWGFSATNSAIVNHGQVTWTTAELALPGPSVISFMCISRHLCLRDVKNCPRWTPKIVR